MTCPNCTAKPPKKLALTAKARAGKSMLTGYLTLMYGFQPFAFGDVLKARFHETFPKIPAEPKPRAHYQAYGQFCRSIDPYVWIDATMRELSGYLRRNPSGRVLVEDVRQPDEYERLKAEGFVVIRINASDDNRRQRMIDAGDTFSEADLTHETEQHVDGFAVDFEIQNDGTINDMTAQFDVIAREIGLEADLR